MSKNMSKHSAGKIFLTYFLAVEMELVHAANYEGSCFETSTLNGFDAK